ncbi:hypothetical protein OU994_11185 [Pseudoduganella sp. SL102]|uniref:hypothetical protein n=1 Tax=Pseudoduganella sp. SL102 TaxID=2995154 RepID=UPI00248BD79B|nr:hypothetical protein [Pseudoduganella sp. SL102]WBS04791.1 hypothetical protein OU994_11185 [Pseudoduganella sp. SL102]
MTMMNLADIRKQIAEATEALAKADTELKWELAASAADVAGMVDPTPTSDLIGAGLAVRKGDWFGAGMSVASMVPYVGDALAKPAKAVRAAKKINALRETLAKMTAKLAELKKAEKQAEAAEAAAKEAKIAKEASEAALEKSAKQTADGQNGAAKAGKDNDCENCGTGNSSNEKALHGQSKTTIGQQVYGPHYERAKKLHDQNPEFFPHPDTPGTSVVSGASLQEARREYQVAVQQGVLPKGHHVQGLALGGKNTPENITFTGESTIPASTLNGLDLSFYSAAGHGKENAKILKIYQETPGGIFKFGLNPRHTEATVFQNQVLKWQRAQGLR